MAISRGNANDCTNAATSSSSTLALTVPTGGFAAGSLVVVKYSCTSTAGETVTVTDSVGGNAWQTDANHSTSAVVCAIASCVLTNALPQGATITITIGNNRVRRAATAEEWLAPVGSSWFDKTVATTSGTSNHPLTGLSGTLSQADELVMGAFASSLGSAANTGTQTPDSGFTSLTGAYAQSGSSGRGIDSAYQIVSATTSLRAGVTWGAGSFVWQAEIATYKAAAPSTDRTVTDSVTETDSPARTAALGRTGSDSRSTADVATRVLADSRSATDATGQADATGVVVGRLRTATESVARSDAATTTRVIARAATEGVGQSDTPSRLATATRTATDALSRVDVATRNTTPSRATTDVVARSDAATASRTYLRTTTDAQSRADESGRLLDSIRSGVDALVEAQAVARATQLLRSSSDGVAAVQDASRSVGTARESTEAIAEADAASAISGHLAIEVSAFDGFVQSDASIRTADMPRTADIDFLISDVATWQNRGNHHGRAISTASARTIGSAVTSNPKNLVPVEV